MYESTFTRTVLLLGAGLVAISVGAGCASKTNVADAWWGDPVTGMILEHRMPAGEPLTYATANEFVQTMEVMGTTNVVRSRQELVFTATSEGVKSGSQDVAITIDAFTLDVSSPEGDMVAVTERLVGRGLDMNVTTLGEESGYEEAAELRYDLGAAGTRGLESQFAALFPDMPGKPVRVGDSWNTTVTVEEDEEDAQVTVALDAVNTLAGFETVDGRKCARVEVEFAGTILGEGVQQGAPYTIDGDIEGSGTWFFAYEDGILVSDFTMGTGEGDIVVATPEQSLTIPMSREFTFRSRLLAPGEKPRTAKKGATKMSPREKQDVTPVETTDTKPR